MANKHDYIDYLLMYMSELEVVCQYVGKLHHLVVEKCSWAQQRRAQLLTKTALQWHDNNHDKDRKKRCICL